MVLKLRLIQVLSFVLMIVFFVAAIYRESMNYFFLAIIAFLLLLFAGVARFVTGD